MIRFAIGLVCGALLAAVAAQAQVSFSPEQNYVLTLRAMVDGKPAPCSK